jgi:four helix bundle protein
MTNFQALDLSLDLIQGLRGPLDLLRSSDPKLASQIRAAASSIALNLGEGRRRLGRDRRHHWSVAAGSAEEVRTALRVAAAWGAIAPSVLGESFALLDRLLAMLWRLTH